MRNQFRKTIKCELRHSLCTEQLSSAKKCAERSDKHFKPTTFERQCDMYERIKKSRIYECLQMTYPFHFTSAIHTALKRKITHFVRGFSFQG